MLLFFYYHAFQESSQDLALFDITSSSVPACSTSSLFPDATVSLTKSSSTTSSALNFPGPLFSTSIVSTESISTASVTFPQPPSSVLTTTLPAALPQSLSLASPAHLATPVPPSQVFTPPGASHAPSASLSHNLQDLALLDLGSPKKYVTLVP